MPNNVLSLCKEYPHVACFIVSGLLLFFALFNLHSAGLSEDYIPTTGEISNVVEDEKRVQRGRLRMEYDFDVSWEMDGESYGKHFEDQLDYRPEGPTDIWVSPDGQHVRFSSSEEIYKEAPVEIAIAVVVGILGFVFLKRKNRKRKYESKAEKMDRLENRKIYSVIVFFVFAIMTGFFGYEIYKEYNPLYVDVIIGCAVGMLACVGIFIHAHIKMKQ